MILPVLSDTVGGQLQQSCRREPEKQIIYICSTLEKTIMLKYKLSGTQLTQEDPLLYQKDIQNQKEMIL